MRFVAALDTIIFGVPYAQGAEVDTAGWTRRMLLQFLGNGIIQAAHITAGTITDRLVFEGDGVSYDVNGEGQVVVTIDPSVPDLDDLADVDMTGKADGDAVVWDAADSLWKPGGAGGGAKVILLENGASVDPGTPAGALVFEKALAPTVYDFRLGSLPAGWAKIGAPTETFSGAGMATSCGASQGYYIDLGTMPQEFCVDLVIATQTSVTSIMFGPRATSSANTGIGANWYSSPSALVEITITSGAYASSFVQTGVGPPTYPTRIRLRRQAQAFYSSYSTDGGVTWSPETPALSSAASISRIGVGSALGAASATVQQVIYRPGTNPLTGGRAKGWWNGTALQPLL
jgi:hypothetical protein